MTRKALVSFLLAAVLAVSCFSFALADENWTCPACGHENPGRANFCGSCREPKPTTQVVVSTETNAWVCPDCGEVCPDTDSFCMICGKDHTGTEERALLIPQAELSEISLPSVTFREYETVISGQNDKSTVEYDPAVTGTYIFIVENTQSGLQARFSVEDDLGNEIDYGYLSNNGWMNTDLKAGKRYRITVAQSGGSGTFHWKIGEPRDWTDLGENRIVCDSQHFKGEDNRYILTPETTGYHHLYIAEAQSGFSVRVSVDDELGAELDYGYISQGYGIGVELEAGKTYYIHAAQSEGWGDYRMVIGCPKKTTDIGENGYIGDDVSFRQQENRYLLTAVEDGTYTILLARADNGFQVRAEIVDQGGYSLDYGYLYQDSCISADLKAGAVYTIIVRQESEYGPYCLRITH